MAGTPLRSTSGKLTTTELIAEAGLRRDLVYDHPDLVEEFKARLKAQDSVGTPRSITDIAERANPGNGESVYAYLQDVEQAHAMPIRTIREYPGFTADELATMLDGFQPPQGYTLIDKHENWARVCDQLTQAPVVRELDVQHPAQLP